MTTALDPDLVAYAAELCREDGVASPPALFNSDLERLAVAPIVLAEQTGHLVWLSLHATETAARAAADPRWSVIGTLDLTVNVPWVTMINCTVDGQPIGATA